MINYLADTTGGSAEPPLAQLGEVEGGLRVQPVDPGPPPAKVDLTLGLAETNTVDGTVIAGEIDYAAGLFDPETVAVFRDVFHRMVDAITADVPTATVLGEIDLVTDDDRRRLRSPDAPGVVVDPAGRLLPPRIPGELRRSDETPVDSSTGLLARWLEDGGGTADRGSRPPLPSGPDRWVAGRSRPGREDARRSRRCAVERRRLHTGRRRCRDPRLGERRRRHHGGRSSSSCRGKHCPRIVFRRR